MLLLAILLNWKVRKSQKMIKATSFENIVRFLTSLLTFTPQIPNICGFLGCFSFSYFLATLRCYLMLLDIPKVFSRNEFFVNFLQLESEENGKNDKKELLFRLSTDY